MAEKRETIEDVARREADVERERAQARADQQRVLEQLAKQMPDSFFELAGLLRENVRRFVAGTVLAADVPAARCGPVPVG